MTQATSPAAIAAALTEYWSPRIIGAVNDAYIKVAKVKGDFVWHAHADEDEMFYVLRGTLHIHYNDHIVEIAEGEMHIVPKGVPHKPYAADECHIMLVERATTQHTGEAVYDVTRTIEDQLRK